MSESRTHEQVVGIIGILAQEANDDGVNEREELGPQTKQAIEWLSATDAALRAENERLEAALREIESKTGHFGEAPPPPEWMPMLSLIAWVGRISRAALREEGSHV